MRLIAVLISLWLNRYPEYLDRWRSSDRLFGYADWLRQRVVGTGRWQGVTGLLAFLLPPLLLIALLQWPLGGWITGLVLGVLALLFAHGPARVDDDLEAFLSAWEQQDMARAQRASQALAGDEPGSVENDELPADAIRGLFWQSYERLFGPIFWLVLLGPFGAVLFRLGYVARDYALSRQERHDGFDRAAATLLYLLDWLPTRISALAFGLVGSFTHAMQGWRRGMSEDNRELLIRAAMGSMGRSVAMTEPAEVAETAREARSLVSRAVFCWLALIALLTITGWLA